MKRIKVSNNVIRRLPRYLRKLDELNAEEYGVAFRKGSDTAAAVDAAFDELKADGTMQALADKYDLALAD